MLICCPECQFERTIDISQIPSSAVMATCPRCRCRFRFRNADGSPTVEQNRQQAETTDQNTQTDASPAELEQTGSDKLDSAEGSASSAPSGNAEDNAGDDSGNATADPQSLAVPEHEDDDPLPPGAVIPKIPGVDEDMSNSRNESRGRGRRGEYDDARGSGSPLRKPLKKANDPAARIWDSLLKVKQKLTGQSDQAGPSDTSGQADKSGQSEPASKLQERASGQPQQEIELSVPWEQPRRYGAFMGLYQTILRVMFSAPRFFAGLPSSGTGLVRPLVFYLLLGVFQTLVERMWYLMRLQAAEPSITDPQVQEMIANITQSMSLPLTLLLSPIFLTMQLCFFASVFFLMLRLVHPENAHFRTVFKVIAYSAAPTIVCVVPLVGPIVGSIWYGVCCFIGCKYALRLPWARTALALGPLYLIAFAIGLQIVRQFMGS